MRHIALALILTAAPVAAFAVPTIGNGSFEAPATTTTDYPINDSSGNGTTDVWTFAGASGVNRAGQGLEIGSAVDGSQVGFLQGFGSTTSISQTLTGLVAGSTYTVGFYFAGANGTAAPNTLFTPEAFTVQFGTTMQTLTPGSVNFSFDTISYTATATGTAALTFTGLSTNSNQATVLDLVSVPEPASLLLLAGGLAGVGIVRRAQRKRTV